MSAKMMKSIGTVSDDPHQCPPNCRADKGGPAKCPLAVTPVMSRGERIPTEHCPILHTKPQTLAPAVTKHFSKGKQPEY
jgi:hypothetical protein